MKEVQLIGPLFYIVNIYKKTHRFPLISHNKDSHVRKEIVEMFLEAYIPPQIELAVEVDAPYIFDSKIADVTGDQVDDFVYLAGNKKSPDAIYQEDITIFVVDGVTSEVTEQPLKLNGGYGSTLFLGDFNQDGIDDSYVAISSGGSGNIHYYFIYSFKDKKPVELLDYNQINDLYDWSISFVNDYGVIVRNNTINQTYKLDLSTKDKELVDKYYTLEGKVKENLRGEVLPLGGLAPIMTPVGNGAYSLLASQRIVGIATVDNLGVVEVYLTYKDGKFVPYDMVVGTEGFLE